MEILQGWLSFAMLKSGLKKSHGFGLSGCPMVDSALPTRGRGYFPWEGAKIPLAMLRLRMPWQPKGNKQILKKQETNALL